VKFELTDSQVAKIKAFHPKCHKIYTGAIDGGEWYSFMPTGLGCVVKYTCKCGKVLDVTESENW
jgi:hypothetical protein